MTLHHMRTDDMDTDWFDDAMNDDTPSNEEDEGECPICGDDVGLSCPCLRD
jgi:hypothetical protein